MSESSPSRGGCAIPWGLLGMIALVGAIEWTFIHGNLAVADPQGESWSQAARQSTQVAPGRDLLFFGDSMVKCGLLPRVFQERTGRRFYNLAAVGGSAASSYFLLRRALDAGARPSTLVVNFTRELLQYEPSSKNTPYPWAHLVNLRESIELCWTARDPDLFAAITLARLVPSVKVRREVRTSVRTMLNGENPDRCGIILLLYRNWNVNNGAMINAKRSFQDAPAPPATDRLAGTWRPDPANESFFHEFLDLAAQHGITVVWLLPPVSPGTQATWEFRGDEARYETFVGAALRRHKNVVVLDGRHAGYETSVFRDGTHLDRDGALALSESVADRLRHGGLEHADPSRWATLSAYRKPSREVPLEDLGQSLVAIQTRFAKSREPR